jgi:pSer/pThr/pTyr-binding forkhead associated (FHA) protein
MDRLGKIFGRKTEHDGNEGSAPSDQPSGAVAGTAGPAAPASRQTIQLNSPVSATGEETYGLKFVFDSGETRTFTQLPITIGRSKDNDLVLDDETVSSRHALVFYDDRLKDICIQDLDSLNGVFIADQPTRKNVLFDGARLAIGKTHLVYRDTGYIHPA